MADLHRQRPLCFRPASKGDRVWLIEHAEQTGRSRYAILAEALAEYRERQERQDGDDRQR